MQGGILSQKRPKRDRDLLRHVGRVPALADDQRRSIRPGGATLDAGEELHQAGA